MQQMKNYLSVVRLYLKPVSQLLGVVLSYAKDRVIKLLFFFFCMRGDQSWDPYSQKSSRRFTLLVP